MELTFVCGNTIVVDRYTVFQTSPKAVDYEGLPEHIDSLAGDTPDSWAQDYHDRFCVECSPENRATVDYVKWLENLMGAEWCDQLEAEIVTGRCPHKIPYGDVDRGVFWSHGYPWMKMSDGDASRVNGGTVRVHFADDHMVIVGAWDAAHDVAVKESTPEQRMWARYH